MQTPVIRLKIWLRLCFASLWSSLGIRLKVETIGEWEIKGEYFKSHITNREQNHRTIPRQWTPRQDGKTDMPDQRYMLDCRAKESKHKNKTTHRCCESSSWGYCDPMEIIIETRTHEIITTKESYPHNSYSGLVGLAWMCHLDETRWHHYSPCIGDGGHG